MALNFTRWLWLAGLLMLLCRPAQAAGVAELLTLVMEGHPSLQSQSRLVDGAQAELRGADAGAFPEQARFAALHAQGQLSSAADSARTLLARLHRADFGADTIADIRDA